MMETHENLDEHLEIWARSVPETAFGTILELISVGTDKEAEGEHDRGHYLLSLDLLNTSLFESGETAESVLRSIWAEQKEFCLFLRSFSLGVQHLGEIPSRNSEDETDTVSFSSGRDSRLRKKIAAVSGRQSRRTDWEGSVNSLARFALGGGSGFPYI